MARRKVGLTDAKVAALKREKERYEVWDTECPGLKVRVGKRKVWWFWGRVKTLDKPTPFQTKIGDYSAQHLGVSEARLRARIIKDDAAQGIHPVIKKQEELEARKAAEVAKQKAELKRDRETFSNVAALYIEEYAQPTKRTWKEDQRILVNDFIPFWGDRTLDDIERVEISIRLGEIEKRAKKARPTSKGYFMANRSLAIIRKLYNWAMSNGYATHTPISKGMARGDEDDTRKRNFTDDEVRAIWNACAALPSYAAPAVRMLMASGQRLSVVTGMKHSEIDRDNRVWTISGDEVGRSKNKKDHIVPLTDMMLELIDAAPRIEGFKHVFCSNHRGDLAPELGSNIKKDLDAECGFDDWTFQALRGLLVTRMLRKPLRIDRDIVSMVEGRFARDVQSKNYDSNDYLDEKREALERWNDHLRRILDGADGALGDNVTHLDQKQSA